jgi:hypothetical protein
MKPWKQSMYVDHYLADCVAMGGIRRSARIAVKSWRDRDVIEFIDIKRGGWLHTANNSVGLDGEFWEKAQTPAPSHARRVFEAMCSAGYFDGTGEPGFLNLHKMVWDDSNLDDIRPDNLLCTNGKRNLRIHPKTMEMMGSLLEYAKGKKFPYLCNPCVTEDTWVMTDAGPRQVRELVAGPFRAVVDGATYDASAFYATGVKQVYRVVTSRGYEVRLTGNHQVKVSFCSGKKQITEWVAVEDLNLGDEMVICNHRAFDSWPGLGTFDEGWLVGEVVGDGSHNPESYGTYAKFWGESQKEMAKIAADRVRGLDAPVRSDFGEGSYNKRMKATVVKSVSLGGLCSLFLSPQGKGILPSVERASSDFYRGFLRGLFDADGSVQGSSRKGASVRLTQNDEDRLLIAQRMLSRLGIASTIYQNRKDGGKKRFPDGHGGYAWYNVTPTHELVVSRDNINVFADRIGFDEPAKKEKLSMLLLERQKAPYREQWTA